MAKSKEDRERKKDFVSVIIPVFNEEATVGDIITRTKNTLEKMGVKHEVLVVDDGSDDMSADIALERKASVLRDFHQGKGKIGRASCRERV